ncbi:ABC transporter permease [Tissierella praeacuta]|uniref:ABC transporter permease n=1 Tax=Tissierella praeacuta TaxID=43131 RepID=UPI003DA28FB5
MTKYIIKRIVVTIPIIIGVIFLTFVLMNLIPGNPVSVLLNERISPEIVQRVSEQLHLNDPIHIRFFKYLEGLIQGDMGTSFVMNQPVSTLIARAFVNTIKLTITSTIVAWSIGIPLGIIAALCKNSIVDKFLMILSVFGISTPSFWLAILLQYLIAYKLQLVPISGFYEPIHLVLPSIVLGWGMSGSISRLVRANMIETMNKDYIKTAISKGQSNLKTVIFHALKNSILPVITIMTLQVTSLLGGAMITENIFSIPGIGTLSISALTNRDMPVLQGTIILSTSLIILGNLVADIIYSLIDPRIRYD